MVSPKKNRIFLLVVLTCIVMVCLIVAVSPLRESIFFKADQLFTRLFYAIRAPEKEAFVPESAFTTSTIAVLTTTTPTLIPTATQTLAAEIDTPTPQPTATKLPEKVKLENVTYIDQHGLYNYCAPANLAMALTYWGWQGNRTDIGTVVKPNPDDFNVMPYEMVDYVNQNTAYRAIQRIGGTLELVKKLVSNDFPVLLEAGRYMVDLTGKNSWMGHYTLVTGFDDTTQEFITQDSYYTADYKVSYADILNWWRSFNYVFILVYPPEQETRLFDVLGAYADEEQSFRIAYDVATNEVWSLSGVEQFFAWFNRGSSMVDLKDYYGAAESFDEAWMVNASLSEDDRPWRLMWYQTGPYFAYYLTGRYQDVIDLADKTLGDARKKILEESFVWRGRAYAAIGDLGQAQADLCEALNSHPGFGPAELEMQNQGWQDCP